MNKCIKPCMFAALIVAVVFGGSGAKAPKEKTNQNRNIGITSTLLEVNAKDFENHQSYDILNSRSALDTQTLFDNEREMANKANRDRIEKIKLVNRVKTEKALNENYIENKAMAQLLKAKEAMPDVSYVGSYVLTAYCACPRCCGHSTGRTAMGTTATAGRTVGCNSLPLGTKIYIEGYGQYVVEDTGGMSSNVIDMFCGSHGEALGFGKGSANVYVINE